jgi:hypothetical protein
MTATLELPLNLTIAALRNAGTGDSLLAALDSLIVTNTDNQEVVDETQTSVEWVNAVNLEDEIVTEDNTEVTVEL